MWLRRELNGQEGFSLAEILVAGLILVVALIPIIRMFDTSFSGMRAFEKIQRSVSCAQAALEKIRSIPFYEPHKDTDVGLNFDIDDHFWGSRSPITTNPADGDGKPDWNVIPEVTYFNYGEFARYEDYRVTVQIAYLEDDTGVAVMKSDWGPKAVGKDRPTNSENQAIHLLLVKLNVYWQVGTGEDSHTLQSIITDTEAIYNIGISRIIVTGPDSIRDTTKPNAAAHWSDPNVNVNVRIEGWGFDDVNDADGRAQAWLVRDRYEDIPITITSWSSTVLEGWTTLYTNHNETNNPWRPKAALGFWSVKVRQAGVISAYLYEGFIIQYPKPVIADFGNDPDYSKTGPNYWNEAVLKIMGGPFCFPVEYPAVRLVKVDNEGNVEHQIDGTVTAVSAPAGSYGYAVSPNCEITATFDFTGAPPGEYHMQVVNTREPTMIGHVASDLSSAVYVIEEAIPEVYDVYVYETGAHQAYKNIGNPWRLVFAGKYFNMQGTPPVEVYLCSDVVDGQPAGNYVQGAVVQVLNYAYVVADFDLSTLPEGWYKGYVKNLNNNQSGWTVGSPFQVKAFNANIGGFTPDAGYNFYENYYDILCKITGNGFSAASGVSITDGSVEYSLAGEYTITNDNEIRVNLNLIGCDNTHNWKVRVYFGSFYLEREFDVILGPAKILPPSDTKYALAIYAERWYSGREWHYETASTKAYAWRSYWYGTGYATFRVRGMGFPMNGQTNLRVWGSGLDVSGNFNCTYDRANKIVQIESSRWTMPGATGLYNIEVYRVGDSTKDTYTQRWELRS